MLDHGNPLQRTGSAPEHPLLPRRDRRSPVDDASGPRMLQADRGVGIHQRAATGAARPVVSIQRSARPVGESRPTPPVLVATSHGYDLPAQR
ncbi:conserved hypothetical protein (plasmid) [Thermomicrobium roseum DSM 5159]|uniref:Uncharacterized protein n=1 Tax=Thermomicrobium roseum (strain ATCC 27502 / DSM 5159 / P-2) TaxID=309801 RepID=B9L4X3_THERP|nr:conserved hypothetical protein [Thermomicrobium roseum DSM 5159]